MLSDSRAVLPPGPAAAPGIIAAADYIRRQHNVNVMQKLLSLFVATFAAARSHYSARRCRRHSLRPQRVCAFAPCRLDEAREISAAAAAAATASIANAAWRRLPQQQLGGRTAFGCATVRANDEHLTEANCINSP